MNDLQLLLDATDRFKAADLVEKLRDAIRRQDTQRLRALGVDESCCEDLATGNFKITQAVGSITGPESAKQMYLAAGVRMRAALLKIPAGQRRARAVHRFTDLMVEKETKRDQAPLPSCRRGCAFCCRIQVMITPDDAALLADAIQQGKLQSRGRLDAQATWPENANEFAAIERLDQAWCPFLNVETRECAVYNERPYTCRNHLTSEDPAVCDTSQGINRRISYININFNAVLGMALMWIGSMEPLAHAVTAELAKRNKGGKK